MEERVRRRLEELRGELARGQESLAELERRGATVRSQLLRISGAIQVLEELAAGAAEGGQPEAAGRVATASAA